LAEGRVEQDAKPVERMFGESTGLEDSARPTNQRTNHWHMLLFDFSSKE